MRIYLLPISTRRTLLYCQRLRDATASTTPESRSYLDRITAKANTTWTGWERAESGWKKSLTQYGNKVLRRIPYEEWGLKTIPALTEARKQELLGEEWKEDGEEATDGVAGDASNKKIEAKRAKVEVVFPGTFLKEDKIEGILRELEQRKTLHKSRLWWSVIGMPISAPFALVPVIPNIPFFYLCFRAYSHWKALTGANHLSFLLSLYSKTPSQNPFSFKPNTLLDALYTAGLMHPTRTLTRESPVPTDIHTDAVAEIIHQQSQGGQEEVMVLQKWNGKLIAEKLGVPEMEVEIERAVEQVEDRIAKERAGKANAAQTTGNAEKTQAKKDSEGEKLGPVVVKGLEEEKREIEQKLAERLRRDSATSNPEEPKAAQAGKR